MIAPGPPPADGRLPDRVPGAATSAQVRDPLRHLPVEALAAYRRAVDDVVRHLGDGPADPDAAAGVALRLVAGRPELRTVLDGVPGGAHRALTRIDEQLRGFRPSARSNAATPAALLRILLLQQVDVLWWSSVPPFADDDAVLHSAQLVSLRHLHRQGQLAFRFRVGSTAWRVRARNYAVRRCAPGWEPLSSGLSYPLARPAMVGLLNEVATRFATAVPTWRGGLWVNCIVRSTAVQLRLRDMGYSATLPSAHCTGYAADIEMAWLRRHGAAAALEDVLADFRDDGVLNVIDEGQAWHVCLNPALAEGYERAAPAAATTGGAG